MSGGGTEREHGVERPRTRAPEERPNAAETRPGGAAGMLLGLQRAAGNAAVARLVAPRSSAPKAPASAPTRAPQPAATPVVELEPAQPASAPVGPAQAAGDPNEGGADALLREALPAEQEAGAPERELETLVARAETAEAPALDEPAPDGGAPTDTTDDGAGTAPPPESTVDTALAGSAGAGPSAAFLAFEASAAAERQKIVNGGEQLERHVSDAVARVTKRVKQQLQHEADRISAARATAQRHAAGVLSTAKSRLKRARDERATRIRHNANGDLTRLRRRVEAARARVAKAGRQNAGAISSYGEKVAGDTWSATSSRLDRIKQIEQQKLGQYLGRGHDDDIRKMISEARMQATIRVGNLGHETMAHVRSDAGSVASEFRQKGDDEAASYDRAHDIARRKIEIERDGAIGGLDRMLERADRKLDSSASRGRRRGDGPEKRAKALLAKLAAAVGKTIGRAGKTVTRRIRRERRLAAGQVDGFVRDLGKSFSTVRGSAAQQVLAAALGQIKQASSPYDGDMSKYAGSARQVVEDAGTNVTEQARGAVDKVVAASSSVPENVNTKLEQTVSKVGAKMDRAVRLSARKTKRVADGTIRKVESGAERSARSWAGKLADAKSKLRARADQAVREQDRVVAALGPEIDKQAKKILAHWWQKLGSAVGHFIVGVIEGIGQAFKAIFDAVVGVLKFIFKHLLAVLIALVVAIVVIVLALVSEIVAAILAAIAAVLLAVLEVVLVISAIIGVVSGAIKIMRALLTPGLSAAERGKLVGQAIVDIGLSLVGAGVFKALRGWRAGSGLADAEETAAASQAAKLKTLIPDDALRQQIVAEAGSEGMAEELMTKVGDPARLDQLLKEAGGGPQLEQAIARAGGASHVEELLALQTSLEGAGFPGEFLQRLDLAQLRRTQAAAGKWNVVGGANQAVSHCLPGAKGDLPARLERLGDYTGAKFSGSDPEIVSKVTHALDRAIAKLPKTDVRHPPQAPQKTYYFLPEPGSAEKGSQPGIMIVKYDGKYSTFNNSRRSTWRNKKD